MLLRPKNTKYKKYQKGSKNLQLYPLNYIKNPYENNKSLRYCFGEYVLIAVESGIMTSSHISATSLAIKRKLQRNGKLWLRVFPHKPVTKKPAEVRMGKGKGNIDHFICNIKEGSCILELKCENKALAFSALKIANSKLPIKTKIIQNVKRFF